MKSKSVKILFLFLVSLSLGSSALADARTFTTHVTLSGVPQNKTGYVTLESTEAVPQTIQVSLLESVLDYLGREFFVKREVFSMEWPLSIRESSVRELKPSKDIKDRDRFNIVYKDSRSLVIESYYRDSCKGRYQDDSGMSSISTLSRAEFSYDLSSFSFTQISFEVDCFKDNYRDPSTHELNQMILKTAPIIKYYQ